MLLLAAFLAILSQVSSYYTQSYFATDIQAQSGNVYGLCSSYSCASAYVNYSSCVAVDYTSGVPDCLGFLQNYPNVSVVRQNQNSICCFGTVSASSTAVQSCYIDPVHGQPFILGAARSTTFSPELLASCGYSRPSYIYPGFNNTLVVGYYNQSVFVPSYTTSQGGVRITTDSQSLQLLQFPVYPSRNTSGITVTVFNCLQYTESLTGVLPLAPSNYGGICLQYDVQQPFAVNVTYDTSQYYGYSKYPKYTTHSGIASPYTYVDGCDNCRTNTFLVLGCVSANMDPSIIYNGSSILGFNVNVYPESVLCVRPDYTGSYIVYVPYNGGFWTATLSYAQIAMTPKIGQLVYNKFGLVDYSQVYPCNATDMSGCVNTTAGPFTFVTGVTNNYTTRVSSYDTGCYQYYPTLQYYACVDYAGFVAVWCLVAVIAICLIVSLLLGLTYAPYVWHVRKYTLYNYMSKDAMWRRRTYVYDWKSLCWRFLNRLLCGSGTMHPAVSNYVPDGVNYSVDTGVVLDSSNRVPKRVSLDASKVVRTVMYGDVEIGSVMESKYIERDEVGNVLSDIRRVGSLKQNPTRLPSLLYPSEPKVITPSEWLDMRKYHKGSYIDVSFSFVDDKAVEWYARDGMLMSAVYHARLYRADKQSGYGPNSYSPQPVGTNYSRLLFSALFLLILVVSQASAQLESPCTGTYKQTLQQPSVGQVLAQSGADYMFNMASAYSQYSQPITATTFQVPVGATIATVTAEGPTTCSGNTCTCQLTAALGIVNLYPMSTVAFTAVCNGVVQNNTILVQIQNVIPVYDYVYQYSTQSFVWNDLQNWGCTGTCETGTQQAACCGQSNAPYAFFYTVSEGWSFSLSSCCYTVGQGYLCASATLAPTTDSYVHVYKANLVDLNVIACVEIEGVITCCENGGSCGFSVDIGAVPNAIQSFDIAVVQSNNNVVALATGTFPNFQATEWNTFGDVQYTCMQKSVSSLYVNATCSPAAGKMLYSETNPCQFGNWVFSYCSFPDCCWDSPTTNYISTITCPGSGANTVQNCLSSSDCTSYTNFANNNLGLVIQNYEFQYNQQGSQYCPVLSTAMTYINNGLTGTVGWTGTNTIAMTALLEWQSSVISANFVNCTGCVGCVASSYCYLGVDFSGTDQFTFSVSVKTNSTEAAYSIAQTVTVSPYTPIIPVLTIFYQNPSSVAASLYVGGYWVNNVQTGAVFITSTSSVENTVSDTQVGGAGGNDTIYTGSGSGSGSATTIGGAYTMPAWEIALITIGSVAGAILLGIALYFIITRCCCNNSNTGSSSASKKNDDAVTATNNYYSTIPYPTKTNVRIRES